MIIKQEGMTVKEYGLKYMQLSRYAQRMVPDMRLMIRKFVSSLGRQAKRKNKGALLILGMDISKMMVYAKQTKEDKKEDREEHLSQKAKSAGPESSQSK